MASGYDVTIKLYQHQVIERLVCVRAVDAIDVFCSCYTVLLFQLLA